MIHENINFDCDIDTVNSFLFVCTYKDFERFEALQQALVNIVGSQSNKELINNKVGRLSMKNRLGEQPASEGENKRHSVNLIKTNIS